MAVNFGSEKYIFSHFYNQMHPHYDHNSFKVKVESRYRGSKIKSVLQF